MKASVAVAVMREDYHHSFMPFKIKKGDEFFLAVTDSIYKSDLEYMLMKETFCGIQCFMVPKNMVDIEVKCMTSKFTIGDIVANDKVKQPIPFRIYEIVWDRVGFWCRDGWGVSQKLESGVYEHNLRPASSEEITSNIPYIKYYDELMDKKTKTFRVLPGC